MGELIELKPPNKIKEEEISVSLPGSKSIYNRLLVMSSLSKGRLKILGSSDSEDSVNLKAALKSDKKELWMGEGGTALRFGLAWAAVTPGERTLDGSERLRQRPIDDLVQALNHLGADIEYVEDQGRLPIRVKGQKLKGGEVQFERNLSSQFISALLMIGPYMQEGLCIKIAKTQVSMPYIEMTVGLMKSGGAKVDRKLDEIAVHPGDYKSTSLEVERDWSSASYFYLWKLFNPSLKILIKDLKDRSYQGDRAITELFALFGVKTSFHQKGAYLESCAANFPDQIDFLKIPDMAQSFAVAAAGLNRPLHLFGLSTLKVKETDRILAIQNELLKFGVDATIDDESVDVKSHNRINKEVRLATYRDHRMAMAFAPLVSKMDKLIVEDAGVVGKSFPRYWDEVSKLGVGIARI